MAEDLWNFLGGLPGVVAIATAAAVLFYRTKFPQIGVDYFKAELDRNRAEIAIADQDRSKLRVALKEIKDDLSDLEARYMMVLEEKEVLAQELRQLRRMLRSRTPED